MRSVDFAISVLPKETEELKQIEEQVQLENTICQFLSDKDYSCTVVPEESLVEVNDPELQDTLQLCENVLKKALANPLITPDPIAIQAVEHLQKFILDVKEG